MISLRKKCANCNKLLGTVPYTTEDERLKLVTSVIYCNKCGITNTILEIFTIPKHPSQLIQIPIDSWIPKTGSVLI
jgi:hypothetical protein